MTKRPEMKYAIIKLCIFLYTCIFLFGCTSPGPIAPIPKTHFALTKARLIRPGISKKTDVLALLGQPAGRSDLSQATPMRLYSEAWSYLEAPFMAEDRITVEFPYHSEIVRAVGWDVRDGEPEQSLKVAKAAFPNAKFKVQKMPDINPHVGETRLFYKETKLGILIIYNTRHRQVESISWMDPSEVIKRTALENFDYPDFCMQGHCAHSSPEIERQLSGKE
jgi:hypothetical protein